MKYLLAILSVMVLTLSFLLGLSVGNDNIMYADSDLNYHAPAPEHIFIDKVVKVEVPVEVTVEKPVYHALRDFKDIGELAEWVIRNQPILIGSNWTADCDDYALKLQKSAALDGYLLSVQLIEDGLLFGKNVSNYTEPHMGNLAVIGNDIYFIEPQPQYFRVVFVCHRD